MRHCPRCGAEYEDSAEECMDCHLALRPGAPPKPSQKHEGVRDVELVTARIFGGGTAAADAELAKSLLESEGIPSVLAGANAARMYPVLEVRLLVREDDLERAAQVFEEYSKAAPKEDEEI
jgi:putative signal transducing protein